MTSAGPCGPAGTPPPSPPPEGLTLKIHATLHDLHLPLNLAGRLFYLMSAAHLCGGDAPLIYGGGGGGGGALTGF